MTDSDTTPPKRRSSWRNPWLFAWIGLIAVVFAVNAAMVLLAIDKNPGLVVENYYERGQDYEKNRLKRLAKDPGWKMEILPPDVIEVGRLARFRFSVMDATGQPVTPGEVTLFAYRPSDVRRDFSQTMENEKPGVYKAEVSFPLKGAWDLLVAATRDEDEFTAAIRISVGAMNSQ